jgi:hypothetical protein
MPAFVSRWGQQQADLPGNWFVARCNNRHPQTLAAKTSGFTARTSAARPTAEGNSRVSQTIKKSPLPQSFSLWLYLQHLECCPAQQPPAADNRHSHLQRPAVAVSSRGRVCLSSAKTYPQGQARPEGISQGAEGLESAQKGALDSNADYELWYQDESEFHLHPHLTKAWMRRGKQMRVPSPGINHKLTVFGVFRYGQGMFYYHIQHRKNSWGLRALLLRLADRARRTGKRIVLVMDQGNPHHAKVVHRYLDKVRDKIQAFWLPHYCPQLNLIERLWKHLKCSRMANVLFDSFSWFEQHLRQALADFAAHPDFVSFMTDSKATNFIRKKLAEVT